MIRADLNFAYGQKARIAHISPALWDTTAYEYAKFLPERFKTILSFFDSISCKLVRLFAGPPNIAPERLKILRDAFKKIYTGGKAIKMIKKAGRYAGYYSPEDAQTILHEVMTITPEMLGLVKSVYGIKQ